jgi:hypothetical protein
MTWAIEVLSERGRDRSLLTFGVAALRFSAIVDIARTPVDAVANSADWPQRTLLYRRCGSAPKTAAKAQFDNYFLP